MEDLVSGGEHVLPRDDAEAFKCFLGWLVTSASMARSLDAVVRTAGTVMGHTGRENLTKREDVKSFLKTLKGAHAEESRPRTTATRRMLWSAIHEVIPGRKSSPLVTLRHQLLIAVEAMMGFRVGEVLGGGDRHGLLANNVKIIRAVGVDGRPRGDEMVEASIEHSKTGPRRTVTAVGLSRGEAKVPLADLVRSYWRAAGFVIRKRTAGGFAEEAADYKVVRVSLMALGVDASRDGQRLRRLVAALEGAESEEVRRRASVVALRGGQRMKGDSADKKYVNVVGGCAECQAIEEALRILKREGFDEQGRVAVVPGPFMRATHGSLGLSHLPMQPTNAPVRDILAEAFERVHCASTRTRS